jgi:hypothetical protein
MLMGQFTNIWCMHSAAAFAGGAGDADDEEGGEGVAASERGSNKAAAGGAGDDEDVPDEAAEDEEVGTSSISQCLPEAEINVASWYAQSMLGVLLG